MIVLDRGPVLRMITQTDHARFAGQLLALWRADGLPEHPRRGDLLFATREHDNGWREADAAPRVDARRGRPHDFLTLPSEERLEIWRRGPLRFWEERPYAALLIAEHALELHRNRVDDAWSPWLAQLEQRRGERLEQLAVTERELASDYRWLTLADRLSLAVCRERPEPVTGRGVTARWSPEGLSLTPFPLAGTTSFEIPFRSVPHRRYAGDADLGGELAAARWQHLGVKLRA